MSGKYESPRYYQRKRRCYLDPEKIDMRWRALEAILVIREVDRVSVLVPAAGLSAAPSLICERCLKNDLSGRPNAASSLSVHALSSRMAWSTAEEVAYDWL